MEINNYISTINEIYKCLQDDESRALYEARIAYLLERDEDRYISRIGKIYQDWYSAEDLKRELETRIYKKIIIFGCGYLGSMLKGQLQCMGYKTDYFCDNYHMGEFDGLEVLTASDLVKRDWKDSIIIIGSYKYQDEMYEQLLVSGISEQNILKYKHIDLFGTRGWQYFDVFSPQNDEIFVDAGAFKGENIFDFCKWTNSKYRKVYAFEPITKSYEDMKTDIMTKGLHDVHVINGATWNKNEQIHLVENGSSTCITENGSLVIQGYDIDSIVGEEQVTFIKMDIEGSELKALEGAEKTIKRHKPKLAICIYHKPMDVIEIPSYIMRLVPEYKFCIRQYTSRMWETVLYAIAEEQ